MVTFSWFFSPSMTCFSTLTSWLLGVLILVIQLALRYSQPLIAFLTSAAFWKTLVTILYMHITPILIYRCFWLHNISLKQSLASTLSGLGRQRVQFFRIYLSQRNSVSKPSRLTLIRHWTTTKLVRLTSIELKCFPCQPDAICMLNYKKIGIIWNNFYQWSSLLGSFA